MTIAHSDKNDFLITGIGSLPHHNIDSAMEYSLRFDIPFLPQMPLRNAWEYMLPQALEGLPGLEISPDGLPCLDTDIWLSRCQRFETRLQLALEAERLGRESEHSFEPSPAVSSTWQSFAWELREGGLRQAKFQIAGPLTAQWSLRAKDGGSLARHPELYSQIVKLILLRALAMTRKLRAEQIEPVIFLDEPGIFALDATRPEHLPLFHELRLLIQTLKNSGAKVGLHCCSNTAWGPLLELPLDYLSFDYALSFTSLFEPGNSGLSANLIQFCERGGRFSIGIIPTARVATLPHLDIETLTRELIGGVRRVFVNHSAEFVAGVLRESLYTPACGLAFHSVADAELIYAHLRTFQRNLIREIRNLDEARGIEPAGTPT